MAHTVEGASLNDIYEKINDVNEYHPFDANTFSDWSMQAGDLITVTRGEDSYTSPVHNTKLVWRGTPQMTISSTGEKEREAISKVSRKKYGRGGTAVRTQENIYKEFHSEDGYLHSYIEMTESYLRTEFDDDMNSLRGEFEMTASHLRTEFTNEVYSLRGDFEVTASHLRTEFEDGINSLHGEFEVTASNLRTEFTDEVNSLHGELVVTAESMRADFTDEINSLHGELVVTAESMRADFTDEINSLHGELVVTAESLRSDFTDEVNSLHGELVQTASELRSEYTDEINSVSSRITQTANRVSVVVDGNGNVKAAQIVAAINDDGTSETLISADKVTLDGTVKINDVMTILNDVAQFRKNVYFDKQVTIANSQYASLNLSTLNFVGSNTYTMTPTDVANVIAKASVDQSTNTLKLWTYADKDNTNPTLTFSKAASVDSLTGNWSGGVLTINTNPSIGIEPWTIGFGGNYGSHKTEFEVTSNGALSKSVIMHTQYIDAPIKVSYLTGMSSAPVDVYTDIVSFSPADLLEAKTGTSKITANGTFTPGSDYIGFSSVEVDVQGGVSPQKPYGTEIGSYTEKTTGDITSNGLNAVFAITPGTFRPSGASSDAGCVTLSLDSINIGRVIVPLQTREGANKIMSNGTYTPTGSNLGFSKVVVDIPAETHQAPYGTAIDSSTEKTTGNVTSDGVSSTFTLSSGTFRPSGVSENVGCVTLKLGSNNIGRIIVPLEALTGANKITENGTYTPSGSNVGFSKVTVDLPLMDKTAYSNGTYYPTGSNVGFSSFTVDVTQTAPYGTAIGSYTEKTTGDITADGLSSTFTLSNGKFQPSGVSTQVPCVTLKLGSDNIGRIIVPVTTKTITESGTYTPSGSNVGFSSVTVSIPHTIANFNTTAPSGATYGSYTNNSDGYYTSGSGSTTFAAIVVKGTWTCDGESRTGTNYLSGAPTRLYRAGYAAGLANAPHSVTSFDTTAAGTDVTIAGYKNNSSGYYLSGSGTSATAVIVTAGSWKCDGVSRTGNSYLKSATTALYKKGYSDGQANAPHSVSGFDTAAADTDVMVAGYANNSDGYQLIGSGTSATAVIVTTSSWTCDGESISKNSYLKSATTNLYRKGFNDGRNAVSLESGFSWSTAPVTGSSYPSSNYNQISISTTGKSSNVTRSLGLYLDSGSWSSGSRRITLYYTKNSTTYKVSSVSVSNGTWTYGTASYYSSAPSTYDKKYDLSTYYSHWVFSISVNGQSKRIYIKLS